MSISNLFYWSYWFHQPYIAHGAVLWGWLLGFLVLILVGLISLVLRRQAVGTPLTKLWSRVSTGALTLGLLGLLWFFFRQERVTFLAWRFWLLIWVGFLLVWAIKIIRYVTKRLPNIKAEQNARAVREKYLPGKN